MEEEVKIEAPIEEALDPVEEMVADEVPEETLDSEVAE